MLLPLLQSVALVGGTVHPMTPGAEPGPATIVIEGDRIVAVGPDVEAPEDAEVVDITGLHVVPGLIDSMVHHDAEHDALYLAAGVTFCRDMGNDLSRILTERQPAMRDRMPGPDLYVCGQILDGGQGATTDAVVLRTAVEARSKMQTLFEQLAARDYELDFLSFHNGLPPEAWRVVIEFAHARGKQVWGPVPGNATLLEAVHAGQDGIVSLQSLLPADRGWHQVEWDELGPGIELLTGSDVAVMPMIQVYGRMIADHSGAEETLALVGPTYQLPWRSELEVWNARMTPEAREQAVRVVDLQRRVVAKLYESGVRLVPGSGAPNGWLLPGRALVEELGQWVRAGIPAAEVLRLATAGAADALGVAGDRGTIQVGRMADLVVLGADPRKSLAILRDPEIVVARGQVLERDQIEDKLDELRAIHAKSLADLEAPLEIERPDLPEGDVVLEGAAETRALGQRLVGERFAVVKTFNGRIAYCSRIVVPGAASQRGREVRLTQIYDGNTLAAFDLAIEAHAAEGEESGHLFTASGTHSGGSLSIERRLNDVFIDAKRSRDPVSVVDQSDVLTALIVAQHFPEGASYALTFEGAAMEPFTDRWHLQVREEDHRVQIQTSRGWRTLGFDEVGAPVVGLRRTGNSFTELRLLEVETHGGPGLPPAAERLFIPPENPDEKSTGNGEGDDDR